MHEECAERKGVHLLTDNLDEFLAHPPIDEIDRTNMAIAGERLRRVLAGQEDSGDNERERDGADERAKKVLAGYDKSLIEGNAPSAGEFAKDMDGLLSELRALAVRKDSGRDSDAAVEIIDEIAEHLWVASAACRGGKLAEKELKRIAATVKEGVLSQWAGLPEISTRALMRLATYGVDERFPYLDDWLVELSELDPSHEVVKAALHTPTKERTEEMTERAIVGLRRRLNEKKNEK